jgi:hypothetical protein
MMPLQKYCTPHARITWCHNIDIQGFAFHEGVIPLQPKYYGCTLSRGLNPIRHLAFIWKIQNVRRSSPGIPIVVRTLFVTVGYRRRGTFTGTKYDRESCRGHSGPRLGLRITGSTAAIRHFRVDFGPPSESTENGTKWFYGSLSMPFDESIPS